ncbi:MAG: putative manganese transporter [Spirochaetota bacterium]
MIETIKHALVITSFVFVMMLVIEYLNVLTRGEWQKKLTIYRWGEYVFASLLGILPGCLGPFAVVTMYSHGILSFGAVVTTMIATSGDEAFVMLAMYPVKAIIIFCILFVLGMAFGALTDLLLKKYRGTQLLLCQQLQIHPAEQGILLSRGSIIDQWRKCSAARGVLVIALSTIITSVALGQLGPQKWNWIRITLLALTMVALFIVSTSSEHFLEEHLWQHVLLKHIPRVFVWTAGALITIYAAQEYLSLDIKSIIQKDQWMVLALACLVGLIPESGPHMVFVTLYAQGVIPFSILLASSIVQDGHGMLPLLANSRRAFLIIKGINFLAGVLVGSILMSLPIFTM